MRKVVCKLARSLIGDKRLTLSQAMKKAWWYVKQYEKGFMVMNMMAAVIESYKIQAEQQIQKRICLAISKAHSYIELYSFLTEAEKAYYKNSICELNRMKGGIKLPTWYKKPVSLWRMV